MADALAVYVPLLNPNEPEAQVVEVRVVDGDAVVAGDELCSLETTKSVEAVEAETTGYVVGLRARVGDTVVAGDVLCWLAASPDWRPPPETPTSAAPPPDLRITAPALELARAHDLDLGTLPTDRLITVEVLTPMVGSAEQPGPALDIAHGGDGEAIVVFGGGGHGRTLIDLVRSLGTWRVVAVVDDGLDRGAQVLGVPVVGGASALGGLVADGIRLALNGVGGVARVATRVEVSEQLARAGFVSPAVVHPSAVVEPSADIADGAQVFAQAYVGTDVSVGHGSIVNTGAVVSHDCQLGSHVNLSPGALLAGGVRVEDRTLVGMGVSVHLGVRIGSGVRIGNGAIVTGDVPAGALVRAGRVWPS